MIYSKSSTAGIKVIGYEDSILTREGLHAISQVFEGRVDILDPHEFIQFQNKEQWRYIVFFTKDTELRKRVIRIIDNLELDCVTYVDPTALIWRDLKDMSYKRVVELLGRGTFIYSHCHVMLDSKIGNHCLLEPNVLLSHGAELADNVILHAGTMIAGKTKVGSGTIFNFKSSAIDNLNICENVLIGSTSNVTKDITRPGYYLGSKARYVGEVPPFNE